VHSKPNNSSGGFTGTTERRAHPRYRPQPFAYAKVGEHNGGIVMDASEGGLQIAAANSLAPENIVHLSLQLSTSPEPVEVQARVVWLSESKKTGGFEFVSLTDEARQRIQEWLATVADKPRSSGLKAVASRQPAAVPAAEAKLNSSQSENLRPALSERAREEYDRIFPPEDQVPPGPVHEAAPRGEPDDRVAGLASVRETTPVDRGPLGDRVPGFGRLRESAPFGVDRAGGRPQNTGHFREPVETPSSERAFSARTIFSNSPFQAPVEPPRSTKSRTVLLIGVIMLGCFGVGMVAGKVWMGKWPEAWNLRELIGSTSAPAPPAIATVPSENSATNTDTKQDQSGNSAAAPAPSAPSASSSEPPDEGLNGNSEHEAAPNPIPNPAEETAAANAEPLPPELGGNSILVTAPAAGSPSVRVSLPQEPLTASASVAIGIRRSALLPPQPGPVAAHSPERLEFGKIIAQVPNVLPPRIPPMGDPIVVLRAIIGEQGEIKGLVPIRGRDQLIPTAERLVREWQQFPTRLGGQPIESTEEIILTFRTGP